MIETVYYTHSTIAQVLAALVALTGVFAVFRVSALLKRVEGYAQIFYNVAEGWEVPKASKINLWAAKLGKDYPKIISDMRLIETQLKKKKLPYQAEMEGSQYMTEKLFHKTRVIKILTVAYVIFSVLLVLGSVYILLNPFLKMGGIIILHLMEV